MVALITGGAGFIGSHVAEELLKMGNRVLVIDDLSTGKKENIDHLKEDEKFSFIQGTILNGPLMERLVEECDIIYHLAAAVGVEFVIGNPIRSIEINVLGTETVLRLAEKNKKKVIIASSSEIYGKNQKEVFKETDGRVLGTTLTHRWSYSCSKALGEFLALAYWREKRLPVIIVRLFNTCGPRQTGKYGMVVPRFIEQAISGKPITIYGDGNQTRSFAYVSDVVNGIVSLASHPGAVGEIFNLGGEEKITISDLAEKIKRFSKSDTQIIYLPYEEVYGEGFEDMRHRVPDTTKLRNLIGYTPRVGLDDALKKTIEYHRSKKKMEIYG
ncbi:MAG: SDR family NAD(P)-dependent oxidoreductase [Elusimicrobiota bacterium]|nr:SDR family NAD(P)-dependent oxidoreductase [Elusimicrobiota bacterium]MDH5662503.1 SDR family NAD(P)-dependent oxidoreductase [Elusimicrobiota bacterium]